MEYHPKKERSLVIIKPDGVQRSLIVEIIKRFERTGLKFVAMKLLVPTEEQCWTHYHKEDDWFLSKGNRITEDRKNQGLSIDKEPMEYGKDIIRANVDFFTSGPVPAIRVVLKADTAGSVEALEYELGKISQEKVGILIAGKGVGAINENDVKLLIGFSPAALLGFNVKIDASAKDLAERQHIMVETKDIIYQLTEWLAEEVKKYVPDDTGDAITGTAKILKQFSTSGAKHVVGARIETGVIKLGEMVSIIRRDIEIGRGKITNLQQQRSDVSSIGEGMECGMQIDTKADVVAGDMIQAGGKKHGQS
jgi:translation initiation factor IF-2